MHTFAMSVLPLVNQFQYTLHNEAGQANRCCAPASQFDCMEDGTHGHTDIQQDGQKGTNALPLSARQWEVVMLAMMVRMVVLGMEIGMQMDPRS